MGKLDNETELLEVSGVSLTASDRANICIIQLSCILTMANVVPGIYRVQTSP